jgi:hypothetical protein
MIQVYERSSVFHKSYSWDEIMQSDIVKEKMWFVHVIEPAMKTLVAFLHVRGNQFGIVLSLQVCIFDKFDSERG